MSRPAPAVPIGTVVELPRRAGDDLAMAEMAEGATRLDDAGPTLPQPPMLGAIEAPTLTIPSKVAVGVAAPALTPTD